MKTAVDDIIAFRDAIDSIPAMTMTQQYVVQIDAHTLKRNRSGRVYESDKYRNKTSVNN